MPEVSFLYNLLLRLSEIFLVPFMLGELFSAAYKLFHYYQPIDTFITEILILLLLGWIEKLRIWMAQKANLLQHPQSMFFSLALTFPSVLGFLYFSYWQTIVLLLDVILSFIELFLENLGFIYIMYWYVLYFKDR